MSQNSKAAVMKQQNVSTQRAQTSAKVNLVRSQKIPYPDPQSKLLAKFKHFLVVHRHICGKILSWIEDLFSTALFTKCQTEKQTPWRRWQH